MNRLIAAGVGMAGFGLFAYGLRYLFAEYPQFGFGAFAGVALMTVLYYVAERTGIRPTYY